MFFFQFDGAARWGRNWEELNNLESGLVLTSFSIVFLLSILINYCCSFEKYVYIRRWKIYLVFMVDIEVFLCFWTRLNVSDYGLGVFYEFVFAIPLKLKLGFWVTLKLRNEMRFLDFIVSVQEILVLVHGSESWIIFVDGKI